MAFLQRFIRDESGPTSVEYAVMLAFILGVCIAAVTFLGEETLQSFTSTSDQFGQAMASGS